MEPDVRGWTLLPAAIHARRENLPAGQHRISVEFFDPLPGTRRPLGGGPLAFAFDVDVPAGGFALVHVIGSTEEGFAARAQVRGRDVSGTEAGRMALELLEGLSWLVEAVDHYDD